VCSSDLLSGKKYRTADTWEHQVIELFDRIYPCISVPHHLSHAAYGYYSSPFDECVVVTLDGGGDFYTEEAYTAATVSSWKDDRHEYIMPLANVDFGSLWFTYAKAIFGDGNDSGKLMGLAAYGKGALTGAFWDRFTAPVTGMFAGCRAVKNCWPDHFAPPFMEGCNGWNSPRAREIARAVQDITTMAALELLSVVRRVTNKRNLALAGGVALNGYLATAIKRSQIFENVHISPSVNDGGIALGAGFFTLHHVLGIPSNNGNNQDLALLGHKYTVDQTLVETLPSGAKRMSVAAAAAQCAQRLSEGCVVAVFCGNSEHGPRALGNRSILASASCSGMRDRINQQIKFREEFRPVAPVVLVENLSKYFGDCAPSPYMMYILDGNAEFCKVAPEACHVDGTARVQTVGDNRFVGQVLRQYDALGAGQILINTSFNIREPIVETPEEAINTFARSPIDALWLEGWWLDK
jgi:carbamoyltransferase